MSGVPASLAFTLSTVKPSGASIASSADSAPPSAGVTDGQRISVWRLATGSVAVMAVELSGGNGKDMARRGRLA